MQRIKGISKVIVELLAKRSKQLGQGRSVGTIGFVDEQGYISRYGEIVDGGLSGLPLRKLLTTVIRNHSGPLLELINQLPEDAVLISTAPGKTGVIVNTSAVDIFNQAIIKLGIKNGRVVGIGILYPAKKLFRLASRSEKAQLDILAALTMQEEKQALREAANLKQEYLEISEELAMVDIPAQGDYQAVFSKENWRLPRMKIKGLQKDFARKLVAKSVEIEQGREVAAIGLVDAQGIIQQAGEIISGGMGYVPARLLASSYQAIDDFSLREAYTDLIPPNAVIVHTHPGGSGVMHMGDAMAGPGTWGRPIVAIGHDKKGQIKGATIIEYTPELCQLAEEYEEIEQHFFKVQHPEEEAKLRKRRYKIAQDFTDLCQELKII